MSNEKLRQTITTAIEDVFVHTLEIVLEEDVPLLADNIMAIISDETDAAFQRGVLAGQESAG
jgi:hypothetical protein